MRTGADDDARGPGVFSCGNGKKFKHCHGGIHTAAAPPRALPPGLDAELQPKLREIEAERVQREKQQGLGRGIVSMQFAGHRMVAVGNTVHYSKQWKTFHDFLRDHLIDNLGRDWFNAEQYKPFDQQHTIVRWYGRAVADSKRLGTRAGNIISGPTTGAQRAFAILSQSLSSKRSGSAAKRVG